MIMVPMENDGKGAGTQLSVLSPMKNYGKGAGNHLPVLSPMETICMKCQSLVWGKL